MRVVVLTGYFPPKIGGVERFLLNVCQYLHGRGHDLTVVTPKMPGYQAVDSGLSYEVKRVGGYGPVGFAGNVISTLRVCTDNSVDAALLWHLSLSRGLGALLASKMYGTRYLVTCHGVDTFHRLARSRLERIFVRSILRGASLVIANSRFTSSVAERLGCGPEDLRVINPGVDADVFRPDVDGQQIRGKYKLTGKRVILTVGRLVRRKGHERVLRCLPRVLETVSNCHYLIVGSGPEEKALRHLTSCLGLESVVTFAGDQGALLPNFYAASDLFLMPNYEIPEKGEYEAFGMVFLEAATSGKPSIGGDSGGTRDAVAHGCTGLLVDSTEEAGLVRAVVSLLMDDARSAKLGRNGRKWVEERFTWDKIGGKFEEVFSEVRLRQ